jgi:hypothetical protein
VNRPDITSPFEVLSIADSSSVSPESIATQTASMSSADDSNASFSSPLGFLQAAFPNLDNHTLSKALNEIRKNGSSTTDDESSDNTSMFDMERAVSALLSTEFIRELAERGLDKHDIQDVTSDDETPWVLVSSEKTRRSIAPSKQRKAKARTFAIADVRQQHNLREAGSARPAPDPWIQISSLAQRLNELLPDKPATFFMPFFHSPKYPTPADAVRAALATMAGSPNGLEDAVPAEAVSMFTESLFVMFEVLADGEGYDSLDPEQQSRVMADAQLSLAASSGAPDAALEVVDLLRELDADNEAASVMGMYHSAAPAIARAASPARARASTSSSVAPTRFTTISAPVSPVMKQRAAATGWQHIPEKRGPTVNPHSAFIPAYAYGSTAARKNVKGRGNTNGKGGKGDVGELRPPRAEARAEQKAVERARKRVQELQDRRNRALHEASRMWRRGNAKSRGGEVAMYFAEQARQLQEQARKEALSAARSMVEARRWEHCIERLVLLTDFGCRSGGNRDVDLHNTTSSEAIVIVREILSNEPCSAGMPSPCVSDRCLTLVSAEPLSIITGKGTHSVGGISVLGPAVRNALQADGWNVQQRDGSLLVRGKQGNRYMGMYD